jgi:hypothetical protein
MADVMVATAMMTLRIAIDVSEYQVKLRSIFITR